jgi:hypothetical protein
VRAGLDRLGEAYRFFDNLYGGNVTRLATASMSNRGMATQRFNEAPMRLRVGDESVMGRLDSMIRKSRTEDMFFAPTPMKGPAGRKKDQALPSRIVYGDADNGITDTAHSRLTELGACLVRSGGITADNKPKYHVYIRLTRAVPPAELETLNRALKRLINGDKWDATTLLRVPGTVNHKYPSKPMVIIERLADSSVTPENLAKFLDVGEEDKREHLPSGVVQKGPLPQIPEGWNWLKGHFKMKAILREWNKRHEFGNAPRRYMAVVAFVNEGIKRGVSMDEIYAYASICEPLLEKQEDENGYSIQKDVYRTYKAAMAKQAVLTTPSGQTLDSPVKPAPTPNVKPEPSPASDDGPVFEEVTPRAFAPKDGGPNPYSSKESRKYLDMSIFTSGDFKIPEPEYFPIGSFYMLYPGMTHCIFGDSGAGKTWMVLAQIAMELKAGRRVKFIDFENGAMSIGGRLRFSLGVPPELLTPDRFRYMSFDGRPDPSEIAEEAEEAHDLVIIDGVDASLAMWGLAMNSATEIRSWYDDLPQKFANEGSTVLLIDHTSKGARDKVEPRFQEPGGSPAKLAVLTGAAFYVIADTESPLVPGRRGMVHGFISRKDKDGFLKGKADKDGRLFTFIIDTSPAGELSVAFEPAETQEQIQYDRTNASPKLDEIQALVMKRVNSAPGKETQTSLASPEAKGGLGKNKSKVEDAVRWLIANHYLRQEGSRKYLFPTASSDDIDNTSTPKTKPGEVLDLDFAQAKDTPDRAKSKRECRGCRDRFTYPDEFVQPHEKWFRADMPQCYTCAEDPVMRSSLDGPDWAHKVRTDIERRRRYNSSPDA